MLSGRAANALAADSAQHDSSRQACVECLLQTVRNERIGKESQSIVHQHMTEPVKCQQLQPLI